jgi:hypothetical protein
MNQYTFERKMDECLSKFKNGVERYRKSPIVYSVVNRLVDGIDPVLIISQLCENLEKQQMAFNKYMEENDNKNLLLKPKQYTPKTSTTD